MVWRRRATHVLVVVLALALAACGSTLQPTGSQTVASGQPAGGDASLDAGSSTTAPVDGAPTDGLAAPSEAGGAAGALAPGTARTSAATNGPAGAGAASGAPAGASTGAGAPAPASTKPIRVGVITVDVTALFAVFGAEDQVPDPYAADNALVEYINKNGGIAGRQVEVEFVTIDVQDDYNAEGQRACETFTEDKKVDIVKSNNFSNEVLLSCLEQRGVAMLDINRWSSDRGNVDHPNWLIPEAMRVDRYAPAVIDNAVEQGVLKRGDKLGVLYEDCPWGARVYKNVVQPAAAKHGVAVEQATTKCIENLVADLGPGTNQIRAAVLKFQSANVTHVLMLTGAEGFFVVMFQRAASEQRYLPKYLVTTNAFPYSNAHPDRPAALRFSTDALPNMSGIGFQPMLDLGDKSAPGSDGQASIQAECRKADETAGAGTTTDYSQWELKVMFYSHCDVWFTLRNLLQANGVRFGIAEVTSGYRAALGSAASALNAAGRFALTDKRLDGVGFVHPLAYDTGAGAFVHTGPARQVA